jgi:hypothetical protein
MKKTEYKAMVETSIEALKAKTVEKGQDAMLDAFLESELERISLFNDDETVGYKEELEEIFNSFQGFYKYEHNAHFSTMALFN